MQELQERLEVGADPGEVSRARVWTRRFLGELPGPPIDLVDTAVLLVSELVTNAVVHTGRSAVLRLEILPAPASAHRHPPRHPSPIGRPEEPPTGPGHREPHAPGRPDGPPESRVGGPSQPAGPGGCAVCGVGVPDGDGIPVESGTPVVIRIEVADRTLRPPRRRETGGEDTSGRGLELVEALAHRWGWRPQPGGKRIWCELDCSPEVPGPAVDRWVPATSRQPFAT
ncbi:ATP-binding protein [Streptomyces sp. ST2-7A]|uniref:ATP-binding protein n=1 Tax=Streptomyces sp. ST2-7A TaxID=2907214 RepID=UPI0027E3A53D|nr:ATP-binding protein [Streptomyces sp. ST2-7A]